MSIKRRQVRFVGLMLALAAIAMLVWKLLPVKDAIERPAANPTQDFGRCSPKSSPVSAPAQPQKQYEQGPPSAALQKEFLASADLRVFALAARRRPSEGGYFYAIAAAGSCSTRTVFESAVESGTELEIARTGTVSTRRLQAIETYRRRCGSFTPGETDLLYASVNEEARNLADPLKNVAIDLREASNRGDADAVRRVAQTLLDLQDPLLISSHVPWLYEYGPRQRQAAGRPVV